MSKTFQVSIKDWHLAQQTKDRITAGHYFVFIEDPAALGKPSRGGRFARLLAKRGDATRRVIPILEDAIELAGVTIVPQPRDVDPLASLVCDRDLYRAEQDTINLFIAVPGSPDNQQREAGRSPDLRLIVQYQGELFTEREVELTDGVAIETLAMLLPGSYSAQMTQAGRPIGLPATFTVAEYTLAPLSGRLLSHHLDRAQEELSFELAVESYQVPFDGKLNVALVDAGREVERKTIKPTSPGRYRGTLKLSGDGPFRLRLVAADDAERVAEIALPGSRRAEREASIISELGTEVLFSMMPEAGAVPLRGGYLTEGDNISTPLSVDDVVTGDRKIRVNVDVEALTLVTLDLSTGEYRSTIIGDTFKGTDIQVADHGPMTMVFAGCFVNGNPFEGYTTFVEPSRLALSVNMPETIRPREDLVIALRLDGSESGRTVPVLLCVRDERLTATDRPDVALGASAKRGVDKAIEGMEDGFIDLETMFPIPPPLPMPPMMSPAGAGGRVMRSGSRSRAQARQSMDDELAGVDLDYAESAAVPAAGMESLSEDTGSFKAAVQAEKKKESLGETLARKDDVAGEPPRSEFPEILFYGIVGVQGTEEVVIPLGDSMGTFAVEAFALADGDWTMTRSTVVVDQPVRVDLELPPAVHEDDKVIGRVRAASGSGRARVTVTRDGKNIVLRKMGGEGLFGSEILETPIELEFDVSPGEWAARVEDMDSGEVDSIETIVGTPGKFRSYAKELGLLQPGDMITLDSADALTLRIMPAIEESFDSLMSATADYGHLCCEQTAAKILAATFMYLTANTAGRKRKAERIIVAGIARERKMLRRGKGFAMYPDYDSVSDHYSRLAVRYLWSLAQLEDVPGLSKSLQKAAREGVSLADEAGKAHKMQRAPKKITSMEEAYAVASAGGDAGRVSTYIDGTVDFSHDEISPVDGRHKVADRALIAYAAAALIATGDWGRGIRAANQVTRQFNEQGSLYSTVDSVAAISLMIQLRSSGVISGKGTLRVNGKEMTSVAAAELSDQIETIEVVDGIAAVEVTRIQEEDWSSFSAAFPVKVGFRDGKDKKVKRFKMGDKAELVVSLPDGYRPGDLVHVALPAAMSWIHGGGKVKKFTVDFEGQNEIRVPVIVTGRIEGKQHFAACVRNMFEEERAASPGLITVDSAQRWW